MDTQTAIPIALIMVTGGLMIFFGMALPLLLRIAVALEGLRDKPTGDHYFMERDRTLDPPYEIT